MDTCHLRCLDLLVQGMNIMRARFAPAHQSSDQMAYGRRTQSSRFQRNRTWRILITLSRRPRTSRSEKSIKCTSAYSATEKLRMTLPCLVDLPQIGSIDHPYGLRTDFNYLDCIHAKRRRLTQNSSKLRTIVSRASSRPCRSRRMLLKSVEGPQSTRRVTHPKSMHSLAIELGDSCVRKRHKQKKLPDFDSRSSSCRRPCRPLTTHLGRVFLAQPCIRTSTAVCPSTCTTGPPI